MGSFIGAAAERSLESITFWGRSYCPHCKHSLRWYDLFPILSYLLLGGKCRDCQKSIPLEYLLIELGVGILVGFLFYQTLGSLQVTGYRLQLDFQTIQTVFNLAFKTFFITVLAIIFLTDLKAMFVPDRIIIPAIWIALGALFLDTIYKVAYLYFSLTQSSLGRYLLPPHSDFFTRHAIYHAEDLAIQLGTGLLIGAFFMALIIMTKGKGMGGGDVKLGAFMGLILGFPNGVLAVFLGFISGAVAALLAILLGKKSFKSHIPFGPFLVVGSLITLFWGNKIIDWYLQLSK